MNVLIIDTATSIEIVAVTSNNGSSDRTGRAPASHSVSLFRSIASALEEAGVEIGGIGLIAAGTGPGSFTGIRIAVATARMLAQVLGIPLVGLPSQLIYAASLDAAPGDNLAVAFDAKKGRVFGALYRRSGDPLAPEELVRPGDYQIGALLSGVEPGARLLVAGYGIEKYYDEIRGISPGAVFLKEAMPSGVTACRIAEREYTRNPGAHADFNAVVPRYARRSDAEIVMERKKGGNS